MSAEIQAWFEDYQQKLRAEGHKEGRKEGRDQGHKEGRDQGRAEEAAQSVLTVLRVRGIQVPDAARERILAQKDPIRLEHWLEKAALAASVAEVLAEPS